MKNFEIKCNELLKVICHIDNVSLETAKRRVRQMTTPSGRFVLVKRKRTIWIVEK